MDEYLEKLFADAFRREVEQEENVLRTLPLFAALASLTLLVLREFGGDIPPIDGTWANLALHGLLIAIAAAFLYVFVFMFVALRARRYQFPDDETEIRRTADDLLDFYVNEGLPQAEAEAQAHRELRQQMIAQFAAAASNNRQQNERRHAARSRAFNGLTAALALSLLFVAATYIMEVVPSLPDGPAAAGIHGTQSHGD